jgi:hypothetical protein
MITYLAPVAKPSGDASALAVDVGGSELGSTEDESLVAADANRRRFARAGHVAGVHRILY